MVLVAELSRPLGGWGQGRITNGRADPGQWQGNPEGGPLAGPCTGRLDMAAVIGDDPVHDRQPQAGALPQLSPGEKRLKKMLEHLRCHPATVVGESEHPLSTAAAGRHPNHTMLLDRVERIDEQIEHHLLDFLRVDHHEHILLLIDLDLAASKTAHVAEHVGHVGDQSGQRGGLPPHPPSRAKSSSFSVIPLQRKASF